MARPRSRKDQWSHPLYTIGFCYNRQGVIYTEINGKRQSTYLRWHRDNKRRALKILEERILAIIEPNREKVLSIAEAIMEFTSIRLCDKKSETVAQYVRSFDRCLPHPETPINAHKVIRPHYINALTSLGLSSNTKRKYVQCIEAFFDYCILQGWTTKSPTAGTMPKAQRVIIPIFTRLEVDAMEEYNRAIKRRYQFALLLAFIGQSAMRIGETLNQQWEDIDENRIFVKGKSVRQRNIPLKQFPRLEALLDELSQVTGHQEYLFHWKTPKQVTDMLKQTAESLGFKARGFHSIRKMRENEWIDDYKYPPHVAAMLCGHSVEIQQKYYRQKPTWSQVEDHIPGPS